MTPKRWIDIGFVVVAVIAVFIFREVLAITWDYFRLPLYEEWVIPLPQVIAVFLGLLVFWGLEKNQRSVNFGTEVVIELSKVTWALRKETFFSTLIVIVMVGIASMILFLFDTVWGSVVQKFLAF